MVTEAIRGPLTDGEVISHQDPLDLYPTCFTHQLHTRDSCSLQLQSKGWLLTHRTPAMQQPVGVAAARDLWVATAVQRVAAPGAAPSRRKWGNRNLLTSTLTPKLEWWVEQFFKFWLMSIIDDYESVFRMWISIGILYSVICLACCTLVVNSLNKIKIFLTRLSIH